MITKEKVAECAKAHGKHEKDFGSSPVQVAVLTERIRNLTQHLETNRKDHACRRGLMVLVGKRARHLRYIRKQNVEAYRALIKELGIRR